MIILQALKWKLAYPTPGEIVRNLLYVLDPTISKDQGDIYRELDYLIELCLIDLEPGYFSPSCIAITCLLKIVEPQNMDPNYFVQQVGKFFTFENVRPCCLGWFARKKLNISSTTLPKDSPARPHRALLKNAPSKIPAKKLLRPRPQTPSPKALCPRQILSRGCRVTIREESRLRRREMMAG